VPEPILVQIVRMKLAQVGMEEAIAKYPEELSGGMRKRAALARAIAVDPEILFCDEPSAGLDPIVAAGLDELLLGLKALYGITMVVVTHDLDSVRKIADKVVMLEAGRVIARGTLAEVEGSSHPVVRDYFARVPSAGRADARSLWSFAEGTGR
jgi:phospholipid/cholesterol/gamma-HCH transport system ATP-binding protein